MSCQDVVDDIASKQLRMHRKRSSLLNFYLVSIKMVHGQCNKKNN